MQNTVTSKNILPLLQEISSYLQQLLDALHSEHAALSKNDLKAVQSISEEKILLMEHLEDLNKERRTLLENAGLDITSTGIGDFLQNSKSPRAPLIKSLWKEISNLSNQCDKQNNINGIVIESNKRHTENALSILQGKQQNTELYSKKGESIKASHNQTLLRA